VELENYPQAIQEYEKVVSINPENEDVIAELSRLKLLVAETEKTEGTEKKDGK
jgi:hypothetical protein